MRPLTAEDLRWTALQCFELRQVRGVGEEIRGQCTIIPDISSSQHVVGPQMPIGAIVLLAVVTSFGNTRKLEYTCVDTRPTVTQTDASSLYFSSPIRILGRNQTAKRGQKQCDVRIWKQGLQCGNTIGC